MTNSTSTRYSPEVRERPVRTVKEHPDRKEGTRCLGQHF